MRHPVQPISTGADQRPVLGSSTRDYPEPVLAGTPAIINERPVTRRMPYGPDDWHGAVTLQAFDLVHHCRKAQRPFPEDYVPTPDWQRVIGSPWRHITTFAGVAKRARGGNTLTSIGGPAWQQVRDVIAATEGQPLHQRLGALVRTELDSDPLITCIAEILHESA